MDHGFRSNLSYLKEHFKCSTTIYKKSIFDNLMAKLWPFFESHFFLNSILELMENGTQFSVSPISPVSVGRIKNGLVHVYYKGEPPNCKVLVPDTNRNPDTKKSKLGSFSWDVQMFAALPSYAGLELDNRFCAKCCRIACSCFTQKIKKT